MRLPRILMIAALTLPLGLAFASVSSDAQQARPCVIELFTSQGCSSCPPADAALQKLAQRPEVIALTMPVDYWDYIGWKDTLAQPAFSARQRAYGKARGDGSVYTPQAVIDGLVHVVGSEPEAIIAAAREQYGQHGAMRVSLAGREINGRIVAEVGGAPEGVTMQYPAALWLARVSKSVTVKVGHGENSGRTVTYTNVVRDLTHIGEWKGTAQNFEIVPPPISMPSDGWILLLQSTVKGGTKPGAILAASKGPGF